MSLLPKSANGQGRDFEALFAAMRGACDPRRKKYLATYFATGIGKSHGDVLFPGLTAVVPLRRQAQHLLHPVTEVAVCGRQIASILVRNLNHPEPNRRADNLL